MSSLLRSLYQGLPFMHTCNRRFVSIEARRKAKQTRVVKRRKSIRSELCEGEPVILHSMQGIDDHSHNKVDETECIDTSSERTKLVENTFEKLLPEIRKPIKPIGEYLYGPNAIYAALKSNKRQFYHRLYLSTIGENYTKTPNAKISKRKQNYNDIVSLCDTMQIPIEYCSKKELNHFVSKNMHQGFVLDCDAMQFQNIMDNPIPFNEKSIWIAFDHLFNEENVGAVLRSSLFFGVDGVIYSNRNCAPLSPLVATTASGALDCIDIRLCSQSLHEYLHEMKGKGWNIVGLDVDKDSDGDRRTELINFKSSMERKPIIVVIGNESRGLSEEVVDECDELVYIGGNKNALQYNVDSLNVASACSVALYHIMQNKFC